ncbi:EAL domain-containing protein [Aestuariirhabdus litorea]|uniref:cyclic-guanylate-specific phosphodiesterase n=1 Tax=Aestuariirhabdus litorea TaxID=2528527 RepID=A0A3P3VX63_9GAMM|nr:EAL domain-containing protein [Aestuariirhabdus litorea]RRJ85283.1 EAL domain-containing protein [Aestuariirhabdus litorea]RWW98504.1 EAL domain-containing protein [Endozoicomonadaceae bacterium GTF-13]
MRYRLLSLVIAIATFVAILSAVVWLSNLDRQTHRNEFRSQVVEQLSKKHALLEAAVNRRVALVQGLAAFAKTQLYTLTDPKFRTFAAELYGRVDGVRSLQLAPDAVVTYVYPIEGNENVLGHNLLGDAVRKEAVLRTIKERAFVLAGPFPLLQGGEGVVARLPIYHNRHGEPAFWGFATMVLDVEPLLSEAGLLEDGPIHFSLRGKDARGADGEVFFGPLSVFQKEALVQNVELPWGSWQLAAYPKGGWLIDDPFSRHLLPLGALLALLLGLVVFALLEAPRLLRREVQRRTAELVETTEQLARGEARLSSLINSIPDMIYFKDIKGVYQGCNRAFSDYVGQPITAIIGHTDGELFQRQPGNYFHEIDYELRRRQEPRRDEEWVRIGGQQRLLDTLKLPYRNERGDVLGYIGVSRDSTERKNSELALRSSEQRYREMIEGIDSVVYRVNLPDGDVEYISPSVSRIFGVPADEFLNIFDVLDRQSFSVTGTASGQALKAFSWAFEGKQSREGEFRILHAETGDVRYLRHFDRARYDDEGKLLGIDGICEDITESKQQEQRLRQIAEGVSGKIGEDFFHSLLSYLSSLSGMDIAFIATVDEARNEARTLVCYEDGRPVGNFVYELAGTPCEDVLRSEMCYVDSGVINRYPEDKMLEEMQLESYVGTPLVDSEGNHCGLLVLLGRNVIQKPKEIESLLKIFAVRASAEMERQRQQDSYSKVLQAVEQSPVSVVITDTSGVIEYVNPVFSEISGYSATEVIGQNPNILKSGKQDDAFYRAMWGEITSGREWHGDMVNRGKDGREYWEHVSIYPLVDDQGTPVNYVALKEDLTLRKQQESRLKLAETVFDVTSEAIILTDSENRIVTVNPAFTRITGYTAEEVIGRNPGLLSSGRQSPEFYGQMQESLDRFGHWEGEIWNRRKNGEVYPEWLSIVVLRENDQSVKYHVAVFSDITRRKENESLIFHQANYDALTDLPNRHLFFTLLSDALLKAYRNGTQVAVLMIDLDRFKWINDTLGHNRGDELLLEVSRRLRLCLGESKLSRLGGDEFAVILSKVENPDKIAKLSRKLLEQVAEPYTIKGEVCHMTGSIGISIFPSDVQPSSDPAETVRELLRHAESAMYRAKADGGNGYRFFTPEMNALVVQHRQLQAELFNAIERDEFCVHYQPIVSARTGKLASAEALVRWNHPERGMVYPDGFITFSEESGQILRIGNWVLNRVCQQIQQWLQNGWEPIRVSVNVSPRQFHDPETAKEILSILKKADVSRSYITLEITEGMILEDDHRVLELMDKIRKLGVKFSIDDFGTGYSSLGYLKRFPVDYLKVDRAFITNLHTSEDDRQIVKAVAALSEALDLQTVIEGVETAEQYQLLSGMRVDYLQGYLFSKPLGLTDFEQLMREWDDKRASLNFII